MRWPWKPAPLTDTAPRIEGRTLLVGGTSLITSEIIPHCDDLTVITGRPWQAPDGVEHALVELTQYDGTHTRHWIRDYDHVLCIAPITLGVRILPYLQDQRIGRMVFLSSNNAALMPDNRDYDPIRTAEETVFNTHPNSIILQPTAISGRPNDPVLHHLIERIEAGRPLTLPGIETRQNLVDYRDVAAAMMFALQPAIEPGRYSVSGPETLPYREIIQHLETALWRPARMRNLPAIIARGIGALWPSAAPLRRAGIDREIVNPGLPGFRAKYGLTDMVQRLTPERVVPS